MKKLFLIFLILASLKSYSQVPADRVQVRHGDTMYLVTHTYTSVLDSQTTCTGIFPDTVCVTSYFQRITSTSKDSVQLNMLNTSQIPNTAGFITTASLVPYIPKVDTADYIETKHKAKLKADSLAEVLATQTAATYFTQAAAAGKQDAGNYLLNTSTSNVGTTPTASSTVTITHNLGRVPTIIRIYGYGTFTANAAATATTSSMGVWNSSGNRCVYQRYGAAITTTQAGLSSNVFAILLATGGGNFISGVIQNVTSSGFDIQWTETGTATAQPYLWEAQEP